MFEGRDEAFCGLSHVEEVWRVHLDPSGHIVWRQESSPKDCNVRVAAGQEPPSGLSPLQVPADYLYHFFVPFSPVCDYRSNGRAPRALALVDQHPNRLLRRTDRQGFTGR